ncbi:MAG: dienelactone hydrolase family protein [Nanoarchaeota archaeon]|nr:dienelactone hydrolase family protein [Nanoarchaeota archaeon]
MKFKVVLIVVVFLLLGCQHVEHPMDNHLGCQESEITASGCDLAEEGKKNVDLFSGIDSLAVSSEEVVYAERNKGYLSQPLDEGVYPGIIMIHEWWGLNENIEDMARLLANEGYVVLAVDLYDGKVASNSAEAGQYAGSVRGNQAEAVATMHSAAEYLRSLESVSDSLASMGWCFGGGESLQLALSGENLAATVIYYGSLESDPEVLRVIKQPVLGIFGEDDTSIPVESVHAFNSALDSLAIENEIYIYESVGHAFANPSGIRYAASETLDAWEKTVAFLDAHLKS